MLLAAAECARLTKAKWNRWGLAANVSELDIVKISWEQERLMKIGLGEIFDVLSQNVLYNLQHRTFQLTFESCPKSAGLGK